MVSSKLKSEVFKIKNSQLLNDIDAQNLSSGTVSYSPVKIFKITVKRRIVNRKIIIRIEHQWVYHPKPPLVSLSLCWLGMIYLS